MEFQKFAGKWNFILNNNLKESIVDFQRTEAGYSMDSYGTRDKQEASSTFEANEIFFCKEITLLTPHFQQDLYLEEEEVIPFQFIIPTKIPTSFEHSIGHIRYFIEAILEISS